jgi:hypothetical protein
MSEPDFVQQLTQLTRRRYWRRLEQSIRDHYLDLLDFCTSHAVHEGVARALEACVTHTSDTDLQASLGMDFGNFVMNSLTPGEFVVHLVAVNQQDICRICMESLQSLQSDSVVPTIVHRKCAQPVAHESCFRIWTEAGGAPDVCGC